MSTNTFGTRRSLPDGRGGHVDLYSLRALEASGYPGVGRLPYSLKILLENMLRREDGRAVTAADIEALARWTPGIRKEIAFMPARVLLQDFTGVPAVVDLAAMRDGVARLGGDPARVNPLQPAELVIDHSVQVDHFGAADAFELNARLEFSRNRERYAFLKWGQDAFRNFKVVPPDTGIVHQVNIEYLARVVCSDANGGNPLAYPDTLVGTDSHTTMVNGLGVVGWGRGRHRSGGGDARPADLDAHPGRHRLPPGRLAARGDHGDRPGAHDHRAAASARRGREVRRVLRAGARFADARGPGHARQHVARVRIDGRHLSHRPDDARLPRSSPGATRARSTWSRPTQRRRGCSPPRRTIRCTAAWSSWTSRRSSRASPAPSGRRIACPCGGRAGPSRGCSER